MTHKIGHCAPPPPVLEFCGYIHYQIMSGPIFDSPDHVLHTVGPRTNRPCQLVHLGGRGGCREPKSGHYGLILGLQLTVSQFVTSLSILYIFANTR